jgi:hypothetical protein
LDQNRAATPRDGIRNSAAAYGRRGLLRALWTPFPSGATTNTLRNRSCCGVSPSNGDTRITLLILDDMNLARAARSMTNTIAAFTTVTSKLPVEH